jgi:AAA domain
MIGLVGPRALDAAWRTAIVAMVVALGACRERPSDAQIQAKYDDDGKLQLLTYDSNGNGTPDMWSHMDGTRVVRIDIDKNEDGVIERREYYDARQKLERVELSTRSDGHVTRTESYDSGVLTRAEEDVDGNGALDRWETYTNGLVTGNRPVLLSQAVPHEFGEAFRSLRTALSFSSAQEPTRVVLVTSAQPLEGKTTTVCNLAVALAIGGARVLVIDADMWRSGVHRALGVENDTGLSHVLTGQAQMDAVLIALDNPRFWVHRIALRRRKFIDTNHEWCTQALRVLPKEARFVHLEPAGYPIVRISSVFLDLRRFVVTTCRGRAAHRGAEGADSA